VPDFSPQSLPCGINAPYSFIFFNFITIFTNILNNKCKIIIVIIKAAINTKYENISAIDDEFFSVIVILDLFGNSVSCLTSPAFFGLKS